MLIHDPHTHVDEILLTDRVKIEPPLPPQELAVTEGRLLLSNSKIHFCLVSGSALLERFEVQPVAIALIITIDINKHGQTFSDVAAGAEMNCESLRMIRHDDVGLDDAITVDCAILLEGGACNRPVDGASKLSEARHVAAVWRK